MSTRFDAVIVGGGMVGAAVAALLGDTLRVAVVEALVAEPFDTRDEVDLRVSAISHASQRLLAAVDTWPSIAGARVSPYRRMRVWDAASRPFSPAALEFDSAGIGEPELGHIVENRLIQASLLQRLHTMPGVEIYCPATIAELQTDRDGARVTLDDGRILDTALVVGADGAGSATRRLADIKTAGYGYGQKAVVGHIRTARHHEETAWQRFMPDGPLALLPLADGRCSIVWSTTPERADGLVAMSDEAFRAAVTEASDGVLGVVTDSGPRAAFVLKLVHAGQYTKPSLALVGDAAHAVHPLAGQGVNMGFLDAAALAQCVLQGKAEGHRPGDPALLRRYERWRKGENLATMAALDGLKRLFGNPDPVVSRLRQAGLTLVNRIGPLKTTLIRRAMGLEGDLPAIVRRV